jgi:carbamate kinase
MSVEKTVYCKGAKHLRYFLALVVKLEVGSLQMAVLTSIIKCTMACQIAAALRAEKLILMTDVPGVLRDKDDISTKFTELNIRSTRELVEEGVIAGGMIPKCKPHTSLYSHGSVASFVDRPCQHYCSMAMHEQIQQVDPILESRYVSIVVCGCVFV